MINQNQLRIGNMVNCIFSQNEYSTVTGITSEFVYLNEITIDYTGYDEIEPIPLTYEYLFKLGFTGRNDFRWKNNVGIQIIDGEYFMSFKDLSNVFFHSVFQIKYLHQLQNIYFDVTSQELTIKTP